MSQPSRLIYDSLDSPYPDSARLPITPRPDAQFDALIKEAPAAISWTHHSKLEPLTNLLKHVAPRRHKQRLSLDADPPIESLKRATDQGLPVARLLFHMLRAHDEEVIRGRG